MRSTSPLRAIPATAAGVLLTAFPAGVALSSMVRPPLVAVAGVAVAGCGAGLWIGTTRRRGPAMVIAAAGLLLAAGLGRAMVTPGAAGFPAGSVHFTGTVLELDGSGLVVDVQDLAASADSAPVTGAVLVTTRPGGATGIAAGDAVEVQAGRLRAPGLRSGPRSAQSLARLGVDAVASNALVTRLGTASVPMHLIAQLRAALGSALIRSVPAPAAPLLLGVAFGWHASLDPAVRTDLQDAGLIHIVAVSGPREAMVASLGVASLPPYESAHRAIPHGGVSSST